MFDTRNDLPANTRTKVIELLNARLADAIDLGAQTKHAHWNVKGPNFIALHELFDKVAESVEEHIDTLAERVTALGGTFLEAHLHAKR
jgi:starvation-inducible DNA-binding protein